MLWAEASLGKTLEVRDSIALLENTDKFRVARAPREGTAELMGREECGEASGAKQEEVQTLFQGPRTLLGSYS